MAAEHATKIYTVAIAGIVVTVAFLALTGIGHVIDAATQHFMLFYAGVVALLLLCTAVGLGLVATDRMFLHPGQRVFIQAVHRSAAFGSVAFLIIHITTEILAQRVHVIDAVVPFMSPFKTFYIGLGTIASDLMILLAITGIMRGRFTSNSKAWRWRAIHYTSYVALIFGIWHGLLGGRAAKPYVDWSYGFVVVFVLGGLAARILSSSLRPKENLSAPPVDQAASSASAPLRAAAMLAQYGAVRGGNIAIGPATGGQPMLSAPVNATVLTALPADESATDSAQPYYEPGYEGPPRYLGAPRATESGPMPRAATGSMPRAASGPMPRAATGPMPRAATGSMPRATGAMPRAATGPMPRPATGPMPTAGGSPVPPSATGPVPRAASGAMPRATTGPLPRAMTGPFPAAPASPQSRTGPVPRATGPIPRGSDGLVTGPRPVPPGPGPRGEAGPWPHGGTGPMPAWGDPRQRPATGPLPSMTGPLPQAGGPMPPPAYPGSGQGSDPYQAWEGSGYEQGWTETASYDQGWLEASHDDERYPQQPPWEGYLPEPDPDIRYREPGPGMPGYPGSREHRYGGDRY